MFISYIKALQIKNKIKIQNFFITSSKWE